MSPEQKKIARGQFARQRSHAAYRGIGWELTFDQWWQIWQESGRYSERGTTGYVMARTLDNGAYAVGNVTIKTARDNQLDRMYRRFARHVKHNPASVPFTHAPDPLEMLIAEEEDAEAA